jgi:hypothetical protein
LFEGGTQTLADLDFSTPSTSWFTGRTGFSSAYADEQWDMQTYSTGYTSSESTVKLVDNGAGGLTGQTAVGVYDGSSYTARKAWEALDGGDRLECDSATAGNVTLGSEDFCARIVWRAPKEFVSGDYLFSKFNLTDGGWRLYTAFSGQLQASLYTDTAASVTLNSGVPSASFSDGAPHYATIYYDSTNDLLYLKTDITSEASTSTAALTGGIDSTTPINLNGYSSGGAQGTQGNQYLYFGFTVGADAQAMYDEIDTVWQHATDPTGLLTTATRASLISVPVEEGYVAHLTDDTLPIGYDAAFTSGLGLYCNNAHTSLVPYSEDTTGATASNITATDDAADAADGFRAASTLLATAADGYLAKTCTTSASTQYTATVWIEEVSAGVTGRVIMYDESNSAELGAQAFTGTGTPQKVSVTASTIAGGLSTSVRVEVDTSTETVIAWLWGLREGAGDGADIRTSGASASVVQSDYRAAGDYVQESTGEIEAVFALKVLPPTGETHYVFDTVTAADRRALYVDDTGALKFLVNDSTGSAVATITLGTVAIDTEYTARCQWDESAGLDSNSVRGKLNSAAKVSSGASFTSGGGYTAEICIGASGSTADTALDGFIQSVKAYDAAEEIAA